MRWWIPSLLTLALFTPAADAGVLYAVNDGTRDLVRIDPDTLALTVVGPTGVAGGLFGDLAYDARSGNLYWIAGRDNNSLYTIDTTTGAATLVGAHGINDLFALGSDGSTLYAQDTARNVYTLDKTTGAATLVGANTVYPGGYTYNPSTGQLILLEPGGGGVYEINTGTGAATLLAGPGGLNDNDIAYAADRDVYYALDYNGDLFRYDAAFNRTTLTNYSPDFFAAVEYVPTFAPPVPEPAGLTLAALAGVGGAVARFRRKRAA